MKAPLGALVFCFICLVMAGSAPGQTIVISGSGGCGGGWVSGPACHPYGPIITPVIPVYGISPYGYSYGYWSGPWASSSSPWPGRTIRLGEDSEEFWQRHGDPAAGQDPGGSLPLTSFVETVDKISPLSPGDPENRIRLLNLEVARIEAVDQSVTYHLSDGRVVTSEAGVILEIAAR